MDEARFDRLARTLAGLTNRRGLLGLAAHWPILGGGLALLELEDAESKGRRKNTKGHQHDKRQRDVSADKKRKKKKHNKKTCKPQAKTTTCQDTCGPVLNNCKQTVDCGSCDCNPACGTCETCTSDLVCALCATCCDDVCCPQASAVCHPTTGACCVPDAKAQTCDGQCAEVANNCGIPVDCGPCTCPGGCPECQVCDAESGDCVGDAEQQGDPCSAPASCAGGELTQRGRCNGNGACNPQPTVSCAPYTRCDGNACATTCGDDDDCVNGHFCDEDDHCVEERFNSMPCDRDRQCQSGFCAQGVCCDTACDGECEACNLGDNAGTCTTEEDGAACGDGDVCCSGVCQECCDSGECSGATPLCVSNTCQPCSAGPGGCPGDTCCDTNSGECVATCPESTPICQVDNRCYPRCQSHDECGGSHRALCVDGACRGCQVVEGINLSSFIPGTHLDDTLYVCAGSYFGDFAGTNDFFIDQPITIIGAGDGPGGTTLFGRVRSSGGTAAQPVTLRGLRIAGALQGVRLLGGHLAMTDCTVQDSALGVLNEGGALEMQRCKVVNNTSTGNGGGIHNTGGPVTLRDCLIEGNTAAQGAGIYNIQPPLPWISVSLDLHDTVVRGNTATSSGGGIATVNGAPVTMHDGNLVCGNSPAASQCEGFSDPACLETCPGS